MYKENQHDGAHLFKILSSLANQEKYAEVINTAETWEKAHGVIPKSAHACILVLYALLMSGNDDQTLFEKWRLRALSCNDIVNEELKNNLLAYEIINRNIHESRLINDLGIIPDDRLSPESSQIVKDLAEKLLENPTSQMG